MCNSIVNSLLEVEPLVLEVQDILQSFANTTLVPKLNEHELLISGILLLLSLLLLVVVVRLIVVL